jgi:hypothetical protein
MSLKTYFICFLLAVVSSTSGEIVEEDIPGTNEFDYLVFAQIWPITSCDIWESEEESNTCSLPLDSKHIIPIGVYSTKQLFRG